MVYELTFLLTPFSDGSSHSSSLILDRAWIAFPNTTEKKKDAAYILSLKQKQNIGLLQHSLDLIKNSVYRLILQIALRNTLWGVGAGWRGSIGGKGDLCNIFNNKFFKKKYSIILLAKCQLNSTSSINLKNEYMK